MRRPWGRGTVPNPPNPDATIAEPHLEAGSRSPILTTDWMLHSRPEPAHIDRIKRANVFGYTGPGQTSGMAGFDAGMQYLGHVPLVRRVTGVPPDYGVSIDDRAYIPATMAGNPVESPQ